MMHYKRGKMLRTFYIPPLEKGARGIFPLSILVSGKYCHPFEITKFFVVPKSGLVGCDFGPFERQR